MSNNHEIQQLHQKYGFSPLTRPGTKDTTNDKAVLALRNPDGGERLIMIPLIDRSEAAPANRPSGLLIPDEEKTIMIEGAVKSQAQTHKLAREAMEKFVGVVTSILENPPPPKTTETTTRSTGGFWGLFKKGQITVKEVKEEPVFPNVRLEITEKPVEMNLTRVQTFGNTRIIEHPDGVRETVIEAPVQQTRQASYISSNIQENGQKYSASTEGTMFVDTSRGEAGYTEEIYGFAGSSVEITFTYK